MPRSRAPSDTDPWVELRGDVEREYVDAQATPGATRVTILREVLAQWFEREIHRATVLLRVTGRKGNAADTLRTNSAFPRRSGR